MSSLPIFEVTSNNVSISKELAQVTQKSKGSSNITYVTPTYYYSNVKNKDAGAYSPNVATNSAVYQLAEDNIPFRYVDPMDNVTKTLKVSKTGTGTVSWEGNWLSLFPDGFAVLSPQQSTINGSDTIKFTVRNKLSTVYTLNMQTPFLWLYQGSGDDSSAYYTKYDENGTKVGDDYYLQKNTGDNLSQNQANYITKTINTDIAIGGYIEFTLKRTTTSINNAYLLVSFTGLTCVQPKLSFNYMDFSNKSITSTIGTLATHPIIVSLSTNIKGEQINGKITYTNNSSFTGEVDVDVINNKATITTTRLGITSILINFKFTSNNLMKYTNNELSTNTLTYNVTSQSLITKITLKNDTNLASLTSQTLSSSIDQTFNDSTKRVRVAYNDTLKMTVKFVDSNNVVYENVLNYFDIYLNDIYVESIRNYTPQEGYIKSFNIADIDRTYDGYNLLKTNVIGTHKLTIKNVTATDSTAYIVTSQTDVYFDVLPVKFKVDVKNENDGTQNTFSYGSNLRLITYPVTDITFAPNAPQEPSGLAEKIKLYMDSWSPSNRFKIKDPTNTTDIYEFSFSGAYYYSYNKQYLYKGFSMTEFPIAVNASQYYVQSLLKIVDGSATYQSDNTQLFTIQKQATTLEILYLTNDNKTTREYNSPFVLPLNVTGLINPTNGDLAGKFSLYKLSDLNTELGGAVNNVYMSQNGGGNINVVIDAPKDIGVDLSQSDNFRLYFKDDEYETSYDDFTLISGKENARISVTTANEKTTFNMSEDIVFKVNTFVTTGTSNLSQTIKGYYTAPGKGESLFQTIDNTTEGVTKNTDFIFTPLNNLDTSAGDYSFRFEVEITTDSYKYSTAQYTIYPITINKKQISFTSILKYDNTDQSFITGTDINNKTNIPYTQNSYFEITVDPPIQANFSIKYNNSVILTGVSGSNGKFTSDKFTPEGKYFLTGGTTMIIDITPNDNIHYQGVSETHAFKIGTISGKGFKTIEFTKSTLTYLEPIKINVSFIPLTGGAIFKGKLRIIYKDPTTGNDTFITTGELSFPTEAVQTIEFPTVQNKIINARFFGLDARDAAHSIHISFLPIGENGNNSIYSEITENLNLTVIPETITLGLTAPTTAVYGQPINVSVTPSWEADGKIDLYANNIKIGSTDTYIQTNTVQHVIEIYGNQNILDFNIDNVTSYTLSVKFVSNDNNFNSVNTSETKTINISRATVTLSTSSLSPLLINGVSYENYLDNGINLSIINSTLTFSGKLETHYTPVVSGQIRLQNENYTSEYATVNSQGNFTVSVPISSTTFKKSGNVALYYNNSSKFAVKDFNTTDDTIPGLVYLTVDYIPCIINFTKTNTKTDWHDGLFTFKATLTANSLPNFVVDENDGRILMKIYDKQTSTLKLSKYFTYTQLITENASWTINPKTESLNVNNYYITCEFSGVPYFYEDTDANDINFSVTKTTPNIKLRISDDKTFSGLNSYTSMTVIYRQQTYLALTVKTDNTIDNATDDNILGTSSFTYSGPSNGTVSLNNNVDTTTTLHGIVQHGNQIKDTINQKVVSLEKYNSSATTYQIKCDFAPEDTLNYTTSFAIVTLKINKYTPVIATSIINEYLASTDANNLVNSPAVNGKITYNEQYTIVNKFVNLVTYGFETVDYDVILGTINYKYRSQDALATSVTIYSPPNWNGIADNNIPMKNKTYISTVYTGGLAQNSLINTALKRDPTFMDGLSHNITYTFKKVAGDVSNYTIMIANPYSTNANPVYLNTTFTTSFSFKISDYTNSTGVRIFISENGGSNNMTYSLYNIDSKFEGGALFWDNERQYKSLTLELTGPPSLPIATPLTTENQGLASIEPSSTSNSYTYTAIGNAQKINANNDIGYNMYVNFTPTDTTNFNAAVEKTATFNIYTANALGTVDIDLDKTSDSYDLIMTFDQKSSVDINADIVFNSNVLEADRKGSLKFYKNGPDENNNGSLINSAISIDESGTTKNPYKTTVSTTIASHPIFTASFYPYSIYATLTPANTTNYPSIKAVVSRSLRIDPRIVLSTDQTTDIPDEKTGEYFSEIQFSKEIKIKATIHTGNPDEYLSGKVTFKFTDQNDSQKVISHPVNITSGVSGNPAYAEFTTSRNNIASLLVPSKYTITCNVEFNDSAYRTKSDDGKNMTLNVKPQPVSFKLKLIDPTMNATENTFINNFLYKSMHPKIVSTFYTTDGMSNSKVYGGTITYTFTNIATSVKTVYVVTNNNTLQNEANIYTFQIPTGDDGVPVLAVGNYSIIAEYDSPNFGKYTNKNMDLYGTDLVYSVNKNSTYIELSDNSTPYVVGSSTQSLTLSAKTYDTYGVEIKGILDLVRFTIFEDNFNDNTTTPVLLVKDANYSSTDEAFKTTDINTLLSGTYKVMVQFIGNDSYNPSEPLYTSIIIPSLFETVSNNNYNVTLEGTNYKFTVPNKSGDTIYLYINKQLAPFKNVTSSADDSIISVADSLFLTGDNIVYAVVLTKNKNKQIVYNTVTVTKPKLLITQIAVTSNTETVAHKSAVTLSVVVTSNRPSVKVNEGQVVYTIDGTIVGYSDVLNGISSFTRQIFMNETATANISVAFLSSTNYNANSIVGTTSVVITKENTPSCTLSVDSTTVKYLDKKTITLDLGDDYINGITDKAEATFYDNGVSIFDNVQVLNGKAIVDLVFDKLDHTHIITAVFNGNRNYNGGFSTNSLTFVPTKDTITHKYDSVTQSNSTVNGFIKMTVTAVPVSEAVHKDLLLNTGTVTFKRGDMEDILVQLHNGQASVNLPNTTTLTFTFSHPFLTGTFNS